MINIRLFFILGFLVQSIIGLSQDIGKTVTYRPNSIYVELLGNSFIFYDLTYDRIIYKKNKLGFTVYLGAQFLPTGYNPWDEPITNITTGINMIIGHTNYFETGVGFTNIHIPISNFDIKNFIPIRLGFRYQKDSSGFLFKIAFTPLIRIDKFYVQEIRHPGVLPWAGIALGYSF